jgi:HEAT repeat protein
LEQNVSTLNRSLILDRLENDVAGKRLRGIMDASLIVGDDAEITQALLLRATEDRVYSVRSAAIQALGPQLNAPAVGDQLMALLQESEAPLVQLALADLVLRNGSEQQVTELLRLAENGALHPDLARHVLTSLQRDVV